MLTNIMRIRNKKGFSMVELIVVIAIIALLAAITIPLAANYLTDARQKSADSAAGSTLRAMDVEIQALIFDDKKMQAGAFACTIAAPGVVSVDGDGGLAAGAIGNNNTNEDLIETFIKKTYPKLENAYIGIIIKDTTDGTIYCSDVIYSEEATIEWDSATQFKVSTAGIYKSGDGKLTGTVPSDIVGIAS